MSIKLPSKRTKSAVVADFTDELDKLKVATYMPRESENKALSELAYKTGLSKSVIIRAGIKHLTGIGEDETIDESLTKLLQ